MSKAGIGSAEQGPLGPSWRSVLFAPAHRRELVGRLSSSDADAVILDLEDSVAEADKPAARQAAAEAIRALGGKGHDVVVRINGDWRSAFRDLEAVVQPGLRAVMVPKAEHKSRLSVLAELVSEIERDRRMQTEGVGLIALVETPVGFAKLAPMSGAPRMLALALGPEDLSTSLGVAPSPSVLSLPCQMLALAAAARGLMALGAPVSIADYRDLESFGAGLQEARAMGMTGALCIHPNQVTLANEVFAASAAEVAAARAVVEAWAGREGGIARLGGRMIDLPVVRRAQRLLGREATARTARDGVDS